MGTYVTLPGGGGGGGGAETLDDLTDVDTVTDPPDDGDFLVYDTGTGKWAPATLTVPGSAVSVDASGFNGNLTTSDDTLQEVAQKLDDLSIPAAGIADPGGADDDFLQRKSGAWTYRTVAQVKTDLGVNWAVISEQTIAGSAAASVTWSTLSAYKEFRITFEAISTDTGAETSAVSLRVNTDTGSNYQWVRNGFYNISGTGYSADTAGGIGTSAAVAAIPTSKSSANYRGRANVNVCTRTGGNTVVDSEGSMVFHISSNPRIYGFVYGGLWSSTSAITDLTLIPAAGSFAIGSYFRLEGRA